MVSRDYDAMVKVFLSSKQNFCCIGMIIRFWSTFNKKPRINSDLTKSLILQKSIRILLLCSCVSEDTKEVLSPPRLVAIWFSYCLKRVILWKSRSAPLCFLEPWFGFPTLVKTHTTTLATKYEVFFTKVTPMQGITGIALLVLWLMLLYWIFISSYTIYFFVKIFIFPNVYISVNAIFECLSMFFGWERDHQLSTRNCWGMGVMRTAAHRGRQCHTLCVCTDLNYLVPRFWQHFCLIVSCFICRNLILPYSEKICSSETVIFL